MAAVYTDGKREYLVLSSDHNDGVGAVVCRLSRRMNNNALIRVQPFMIKDNEAGDTRIHIRENRMIRPTYAVMAPSSAIVMLNFAIGNYRLEQDDGFKQETLGLAIEALDRICMHLGPENPRLTTYLLRQYNLPRTQEAYDGVAQVVL